MSARAAAAAPARPITMHFVTMSFSDAAVERAYRVDRFRRSYSIFAIGAFAIMALSLVFLAAAPKMWFGTMLRIAAGSIVLLARMCCHRMQDQERALRIFNRVCVCTWTVFGFSAGVRQRLRPYISGVEAIPAFGVAFSFGLVFFWFRTMGYTFEHRTAIMLSCSTLFYTFSPPFSVLGEYEGFIMVAAILLGNAAAYPNERYQRERHLQRRRKPRERSSASIDMAPFTLRFESGRGSGDGDGDGDYEERYLTHRFVTNFRTHCAAQAMVVAVDATRAFEYPEMPMPLHFCFAATGLLLLRARLHYMADQRRARNIFALGVCVASACASLLFVSSLARAGLRASCRITVNSIASLAALFGMYALSLRNLDFGTPGVAFLGVMASPWFFSGCWCFILPPELESDPLCSDFSLWLLAAFIVGDLLGRTLDFEQRLAYISRRVTQLADDDRTRAHAHFAWGWCALVILTSSGIWAMQRRFVLASGLMNSLAWLCGPAVLHLLFALFQRFIALPVAPRLLALAALGVGHTNRTPPFSEFGQPHEGMIIVAALLVGELLSLPFDMRRRTAFAREARAAEREPATTGTSAVADTARILLHPLTLRFLGNTDERTYAARSFGESYPMAVALCLALTALMGVSSLGAPATLEGAADLSACAFCLTLLGTRVWLHHDAGRARADAPFAWSWCTAWMLVWAGLTVAHRRLVPSATTMPAQLSAFITALHALVASLQRFALPGGPRLFASSAIVLTNVAGISVSASSLAQPHEALLVVAAVFVGELLGHPFELKRRLAYLQLHKHELLLAASRAKAQATEARLLRCFKAGHDLMATLEVDDGLVRITHLSESYAQLGHALDAGRTMPLSRLFYADEVPAMLARLAQAHSTSREVVARQSASGAGHKWEQVLLRADGHEVRCEHTMSHSADDTVALLISRDITERDARQRLEVANSVLRAEAAALKAQRLRALSLGCIADVVLDVRMDAWSLSAARACRVTSANAASFEALFGVRISDAEGFWPSLCADDETRGQLERILFEHAPDSRTELSFRRPDTAQVRTVRVSVLHPPDAEIGELLVVVHDLTDFKRRLQLKQDRELLLAQVNLERMRQDLQKVSTTSVLAELPRVASATHESYTSSVVNLIRVPTKVPSSTAGSRVSKSSRTSNPRSTKSAVSWVPARLLRNLGGRMHVPRQASTYDGSDATGRSFDGLSDGETEAASEIEVLTTAAAIEDLNQDLAQLVKDMRGAPLARPSAVSAARCDEDTTMLDAPVP